MGNHTICNIIPFTRFLVSFVNESFFFSLSFFFMFLFPHLLIGAQGRRHLQALQARADDVRCENGPTCGPGETRQNAHG